MDVDLVVNRDQEEPVLEVVRLNQARAGVGIRGALELERVHLVKEEILEQLREHLTEELPYLKQEELHLKRLHLRRRLRQEELLLKRMYVAVA